MNGKVREKFTFKAILSSLRSLCFYLKATFFALNIDYNQAKKRQSLNGK
jgi:hypothetical protein